MSGFYWNIRGFNKASKQEMVKEWVKKRGFQFGCLIETRVKENKIRRIVNKVFPGWSYMENYEHNRLGRMWIVWKQGVRVTPCFQSEQLLTVSILMEGLEEEFYCSFVYGLNLEEERRELWRDFKSHQDSPIISKRAWIIQGDFNEILSGIEHSVESSSHDSVGMREFQEVVEYCRLLDMSYQGPRFTWSNKRENGIICKKLDRTLVNEVWLQSYPQSYCVFEAGGCSDHQRCRVIIKMDLLKPRKPFKFVNALVDTPEFLRVVESFWSGTENLFVSTSALFRLSKKLKALKPLLRNLGKEKFGDIFKRTGEAYKVLCEAQIKTLEDPNQNNVMAESTAYGRWSLLSMVEERVISQKAKVHWLSVGDGNNKNFHQAAKMREVRNAIREIRRLDGSVAESQEDIKKEAVDHFRNFLTHIPSDYREVPRDELKLLLNYECSEEDGRMLIGVVNAEEVKKVLFSMAADKSPGPDGYTSEFFKASWSITGRDFVVAVQSFFEKGFLPKGINSTILALIPKKNDATYMKDYRPISCCNVLYKVISKILANRMKRLLPLFISLNQSAFVKDRLIMENVLLASELVKSYHKDSVTERCAVKIDISKAFDSVQWSFLLSVLEALNFPAKFILWIKKCIELASFSIQINGELAGYFNSRRGLRQGCALSPYLFVICMQVLTKLLDKAAVERRIGYHPYCRDLNLTHICFADDVLVFSDGKKNSIEGILEVFQDFAKISGLNISLEKSTLFLAGVKSEDNASILEQFPFEAGSLPVRYLGLPLLTKKMSVQDYSPLISRIRTRVSSWTAKHLSFAGRLQLIGSVIYSITNFWMSAFRLPSQCIKEIHSICSAFLWSGPTLSTRKAKIAWADVCKPRDEGGLGLRNLLEANRVACLKLIWRVLSARSSLWVKWIWKYLIRKGSFWSVNERSTLGSWMWRKLLKMRAVAVQFFKVEINSGSTTSFWFDRWSPLGVLIDFTGGRGCVELGIPINATVERVIQTYRRRRRRVPILQQIEQEIMALQERSLNQLDDVCLWKRESGDYASEFSTSQTWNLLREKKQKVPWSKGIWFPEATPKFSFMAWIVIHNRLATGDRILKWNPQAVSVCWLCKTHLETRDHLFFECEYSKEVWLGLTRGLTGSGVCQWLQVMQILTNGLHERVVTFLWRYCFQSVLHAIWMERNTRRVEDKALPTSCLMIKLDKQVRNRITSLRRKNGGKYEKAMEEWFKRR